MLTSEQREARRNGLGASDTPIIMGYSSYKTPYQLYLEKTGTVADDDEETEQQYWGNALEPLIIERFAKENNVEVTFPDTIHHPDYPYIFANLDGWIESEKAVVEAKLVNSFKKKEWDSTLSDGIPLTYLIQVAKQCLITDASRGYIAVLFGGMEFQQFVYERDKMLEDLILKADIEFWHCVQTKNEPAVKNVADCRIKYREIAPDKVALTNFKTETTLSKLIQTKQKIKELSEAEDSFKMNLMDHMKDAEYLTNQDGEILATWKANKRGTRVFNIK